MVRRPSLKEELSKKFELLVQQEVKNYNDSKLATNISINKLDRKLEVLSEKYAQQLDHSHNIINKIESENFDLKINVLNLEHKLERLTKDFEKYRSSKDVLERNTSDLVNQLIIECTECKSKVKRCSVENQADIEGLKRSVEDINENIITFYRKTQKNDVVLKNEILSLPSEVQSMKKELFTCVQSNKIDVNGVNENINLFRDEFNYEKKKIENIYNLISRLEKRG